MAQIKNPATKRNPRRSDLRVELAHAREQVRHRNAELAIINSVQQALASHLDLQAIFDLVGDKLREIFDAQVVTIVTMNPGDPLVYPRYLIENGKRLYPAPYLPSRFAQRLIETRESILVHSREEFEALGAVTTPGTAVTQSGIYVPLLVDGELRGGLSLQNIDRANAFNEADVRLLETLANSMSIALENARLFNELQTRNREITEALEQQTATSEILRVIARSPIDVQPVMDVIAENARRLLNGLLGGVYRVEGDLINEVGTSNYSSEGLREHDRSYPRPLAYDSSVSSRAILDRAVVSVPDILNDPSLPELTHRYARVMGMNSVLVVPMMRDGEAIGSIAVGRREKGAFNEKQIALLQTFADQAVIAIENVRLFNETKRLLGETQQRAAELEIINRMSDALAGQIDLDALIQLVGDKLRETFRADIVYIALVDRAREQIDFPYYSDQGKPRTDPPLKFGQGLTSKIIETREPLWLNQNIEQRRAELGVTRQGTPARSYLGVPIIVGEQAIGVISLQSTERENQFDEGDVRLLTTIAVGVGIAIDKARLYREIQHRRQYFEGIVQNSPVAIVTFDLDSRIVSWNPAAEKLFGYTETEAQGRDINDMIAFSDEIRAEATACTLRASRGEASSYITRRHRRDGSLVDVQMWALPVFVGDERVGAIALYNDISDLQRARREAESANQAKSAFLATMSHEIRTPMNAVIGMSNLLLGTSLNDEQREYADIIRNSGDALLTIINDILDFSKIEAGKMELEYQPFDLRECVESALDLVNPRANEKGIDLAYEIADDVPAAIIGDAARLRQILLNLLSNAIKFTEQGEVVVSVQWAVNSESNSVHSPPTTLHFSVRDTGIGITPQQMPRLFQSFSQADASTSRKYGGTGLGLAISKRLVELMGGTMRAVSAGAGKGSTFIFSIRAEPAQVLPQRPARAYPIGEQPQLRGKRALIVDDNETNRRILARQLQLWGMATMDVASAQDALLQFERDEKFDVAILDLQMPAMDGIALAREIRKIETTRGARELMPLILFSSLGRREINADEIHFAAYLLKPLKPSLLFDTLAGLFARDELQTKSMPSAPSIDMTMATRMPLRILLAEDNAVNQKLALRILSQMGYRADVAGNGIEAIEAVARQKYDVILMDVQMPEMDGLEATRRIVAQSNERPRIIAMTANATQDDRALCLAAGMDDYIAKPIRVDELVNALVRAGNRNG